MSGLGRFGHWLRDWLQHLTEGQESCVPGEPISVALSRKTKISEIMGAKTLTPRSSTPVKSEEEPTEVEPHEPTKHIENTTKGMRVTFPDGTVIWHRQAIDTFIDALRKIGLERIPAVGIEHGNGYNLVSRDKRPTVPGRIWQHECDGWYIYSNISNLPSLISCKNSSASIIIRPSFVSR